jgi:aminoglycoside phosphotransferase (APT) family kinase protein
MPTPASSVAATWKRSAWPCASSVLGTHREGRRQVSSVEPGFGRMSRRLRADEAEPFVRDLNAHTGSQLRFLGMAELGETNAAAYVQWPHGRQGVLTRTRYPIEHLERTAAILDSARAHGVPVPRYELIAQVDDWMAIVQERMPGEPLAGSHIDLPMMEAILALNESFDRLLIHQPTVPTLEMRSAIEVTSDGTLRYGALERYDDRTRHLFARIREIHEASDHPVPGHDLVHGDFSPPNILFDEARNLTGIVDWHDHTLYRGDRRYSLVTLRFELAWAIAREWTTVDPDALERLDQELDTIEPAALQLYWTHPSLNLLGAMIREGRHTDVDHLLTIASSRLL